MGKELPKEMDGIVTGSDCVGVSPAPSAQGFQQESAAVLACGTAGMGLHQAQEGIQAMEARAREGDHPLAVQHGKALQTAGLDAAAQAFSHEAVSPGASPGVAAKAPEDKFIG